MYNAGDVHPIPIISGTAIYEIVFLFTVSFSVLTAIFQVDLD